MNSNSIVCICLKKKTYPSKGASGSSPEDPLTCHRARRNTHIAMETLRRNMRIAKRDTHIATENLPPRRASTRDTQKSAFSDKISTTTQTPRFYSQPVLIAFADRLDVLSAQDEALHRRRSMSSYRKGRGASLAIVGLKGGMSQG
jgi:hypothetical protein